MIVFMENKNDFEPPKNLNTHLPSPHYYHQYAKLFCPKQNKLTFI